MGLMNSWRVVVHDLGVDVEQSAEGALPGIAFAGFHAGGEARSGEVLGELLGQILGRPVPGDAEKYCALLHATGTPRFDGIEISRVYGLLLVVSDVSNGDELWPIDPVELG